MNRFAKELTKVKEKVTRQKVMPLPNKLPTFINYKPTQRLTGRKPKVIMKLDPLSQNHKKTLMDNIFQNLAIKRQRVVTSTKAFVQNVSQKTFGKYLLLTNTTVTVSLSGAGDYMQQIYQIKKGTHKQWDKARTLKLSLTGITIGPACHYWYLYLDKWFPGKTLSVLVKKILCDQILFSPVCITLFFLSFGLFSGHSLLKIKDELYWKGTHLFVVDMLVWPVAQFVNFKFLPTKFRVIYDNTISLLYDCYYSYVTYYSKEGNEEKKGEEHIRKSLP
ncbi:mpv17-like protein 2 [Lingula anatina]|uniref:Mpv17-like protein 2 n=1 Tax=Lingula anatina TaxID=7574 RepID=A0A1S3H828_LINAN|nr:mpv17-like protein 2 [Lingula anatina]|eukprot:XP_013382153.1 mpv17-like protein 2 [Lingula anatina]